MGYVIPPVSSKSTSGYAQKTSSGKLPGGIQTGKSRAQLANVEFCLAQLPLHHSAPIKNLHHCWCHTNLTAHLVLHFMIIHGKDLKIPLTSRLWVIPAASDSAANHPCVCRGSQSDEGDRTTSSAKSRNAILRFPKQTHPSCALRFCPLISQTGPETKGKLSGGQKNRDRALTRLLVATNQSTLHSHSA